MPFHSRGKDKNPTMKWECTNRGCDNTKKTYKPGAHEGAKAIMMCKNCGARETFELVEIIRGGNGGIPK